MNKFKVLYFKILCFILLTPIILSCQDFLHTHPAEIHRWYPPTNEELEKKREQQKILDKLELEIQNRFLFQENLNEEKIALLDKLKITQNQIIALKPEVQKQIDEFIKLFKEIQIQLAGLEVTNKNIDNEIARYKKSLVPIKKTAGLYVSAIRWFQKGQFSKSIKDFNRLLKQNPPHFLKDNIYFGLGTAFYKLKKWDSAIKQFNKVIEDYPYGNKWPISHLMLGLIYKIRNETSRALYILEDALEKPLSDSNRGLIIRLLKAVKRSAIDENS